MRFRRIEIDGYGRLTNRVVEVSPGLHVIVGPNEQGKSTLRGFVGDMLYGQKRNTTQRSYDEANELRTPWPMGDSATASYGGRLIYQLDDGREIEIFRRFNRDGETVQIFDRTHARDITGEFERLRNREIAFAQAQLGISKDVFLNTATISHMSLEGLGDADALSSIREKLLSLADSGDGGHSADAALKRLDARIASIGQPLARTRPLPAARARLADLNREYAEAERLQADLTEMERKRKSIADQIVVLRGVLADVEDELAALECVERADRLREADALMSRIDELTPRCFELRDAQDFPLEQRHEFQRTEMLCANARQQVERWQQEYNRRQSEINDELMRLGVPMHEVQDSPGMQTVPEEYDQRLTLLEEKMRRLRIRMEEIEAARDTAQQRLKDAERELASLPDFSRVADDPVRWLNDMTTSFRLAQRARDEERQKNAVLREKTANLRRAIEEPEKIFSLCDGFESGARDYEVRIRMRNEQIAQIEGVLDTLRAVNREYGARVPGFAWLSVLTGSLSVGLAIVALTLNPGVFVASGLAAVAMLYFVGNMVYARSRSAKALKESEEAESKIFVLKSSEDSECKRIEEMMVAAGCQTIRELEAKYDCYQKDRIEYEAVAQVAQEQAAKASETEHRVNELLEDCSWALADVGERPQTEDEVEEAAGRAVARYQSYRDAKRRIAENRDQVKRHDADILLIQTELDACRKEEVELGVLVRQLMREGGYPEESKHDSVLTALRSYRIRTAQLREKRRLLQQTLVETKDQLEAEQRSLAEHTETLSRYLSAAGVQCAEEWHERARRAEEFRDVRQRLDALNEQMGSLLRGQSLVALRAAVEVDGPCPEPPQRSAEELKRLREKTIQEIDRFVEEEHRMHLTVTERSAGVRSFSEIEEERALTETQVRELEVEIEAASHAMALIEEIARDKHSRIAPKLAAIASAYLSEITAGAYSELLVSRDLRVSVRIPATQRMNEEPESVLSKGTVDQIYLALRLALIQCIGATGESIPMLLDDPFANYDDERLQRAVGLLARVAETNQVILFTCRDDVVRAARTVNAPVLEL